MVPSSLTLGFVIEGALWWVGFFFFFLGVWSCVPYECVVHVGDDVQVHARRWLFPVDLPAGVVGAMYERTLLRWHGPHRCWDRAVGRRDGWCHDGRRVDRRAGGACACVSERVVSANGIKWSVRVSGACS